MLTETVVDHTHSDTRCRKIDRRIASFAETRESMAALGIDERRQSVTVGAACFIVGGASC